jgi:hypothetical protein
MVLSVHKWLIYWNRHILYSLLCISVSLHFCFASLLIISIQLIVNEITICAQMSDLSSFYSNFQSDNLFIKSLKIICINLTNYSKVNILNSSKFWFIIKIDNHFVFQSLHMFLFSNLFKFLSKVLSFYQ